MERLDRFLAAGGVESRRRVKEVVRSGRVCVNGAVISEPEFKVDPEKDVITLDGRRIGASAGRKVVMLHKPAGCITAARDEKERTVMECLPPEYRKLMPIGRLDKETEGLLLFTNDGDLAHRLLAPKSHVVKEYYAEHIGQATEEDVTAFAEGCVLRDGTKCLPAELIPLGAGKSTIRIREGKYHQVRRMMASRAMTVTYLRRVAEGGVRLGDLPIGMSREMTQEEIESLTSVDFDEKFS